LQFKKKLSAARLKMPARGQLEIYCRQNTLTVSRGALPTTSTLPGAKRGHHRKCETICCAGLVEFTVRMICLVRLCEVLEAQPHTLLGLMRRAAQGFVVALCEIAPGFRMSGCGQLDGLLLVYDTKGLLYLALTNACTITPRSRHANLNLDHRAVTASEICVFLAEIEDFEPSW
jgi:hypothetical protein